MIDTNLVEGKPLSTEPFPSDIIAKLEAALREMGLLSDSLKLDLNYAQAENFDLRSRVAELEAIAKNIADQKTTAEMIEEHGDEEGSGGDFEYAYNKIIEIARTAFAPVLPLSKEP